MSVGICNRYPCDHAYRRLAHRADEAGDVLHYCGAGSDMREDDESPTGLRNVYRVGIIAWNGADDDTGTSWKVEVETDGGVIYFEKLQDALSMSSSIAQAVLWASEANGREGWLR